MIDLKKVMKPNVAVVCNSKEEWDLLMIEADKAGLTWCTGAKYPELNPWNRGSMTKTKGVDFLVGRWSGTFSTEEKIYYELRDYTIYSVSQVLNMKPLIGGKLC